MRKRVGALIIKDKKLLLVTGSNSEFYWTPGGTIEGDETDQKTLVRELDEELGVKLKTSKFFVHSDYPKDNVTSNFYLVDIEGQLKPANEVASVTWYSRDNFEKRQPPISTWLVDKVIPELIKNDYL